MTKDLLAPPFAHHENITVGMARVIYDYHSCTGLKGYHLVGGNFTTDKDEAYAYAGRMDKCMQGAKPMQIPAACEGANCGATDGNHSAECIAETAVSQGRDP